MIAPSYYIDWRSTKGLKALAEEPFLPLAMAEASKFYRKQERGRFKFEEFLQVATEALITSKGVKAIRGALLDHARDDRKLVHDVEMSEAEYVRTRGDLAPKPATAGPLRTYIDQYDGKDVRVRVYPPGPYRSNHQLLTSGGKVSSKHNKVSVALGRSEYKDGWTQVIGGQTRAKIDKSADDEGPFDPRSPDVKWRAPPMSWPSRRAVTDHGSYAGAGRKQRFSKSYFNAGEVRRPDFDELSHVPMREAEFCSRSGLWGQRQFSFEELSSRSGGGKVTSNYKRIAQAVIRRSHAPPLTMEEAVKRSGPRTSGVAVPPEAPVLWSPELGEWLLGGGRWGFHAEPESAPRKTFQRAPVASLASTVEGRLVLKQLAWVDRPDLAPVGWHREAGSFDSVRKDPWGLLDHGVFCRGRLPYLGRGKNPWERGKNIFSPTPVVESPSRVRLDRAVEHFWKNTVARWIGKKSRRKLFLPESEKTRDWGESIYEGGAPSRLAHGPAVRSGSRAGRATALLPVHDDARAHPPRCDFRTGCRPLSTDQPAVAGGTTPFYPEPIPEDAPHLWTRSPLAQGGRSI